MNGFDENGTTVLPTGYKLVLLLVQKAVNWYKWQDYSEIERQLKHTNDNKPRMACRVYNLMYKSATQEKLNRVKLPGSKNKQLQTEIESYASCILANKVG